MIITTNYSADALYLPSDDRRHLVAASTITKHEFSEEYWTSLWAWYENGGIGDVAAQTEKAMNNIAMLLDEAGSSLQDIVKVTVYLTDIRYRETVYRIMGRWLKGVYPVSTGLVVEALARPEWLVEIDATAVISESEDVDK